MKRFVTLLLTVVLLSGYTLAAQAAPQVVWTDPAAGAVNVDVSVGDFLAQFNDAEMDADSFAGRVSVDNGAPVTGIELVDSPEGDYLRVVLGGNLKYSTSYTVRIDGRVQNNSGYPMGVDHVWSFTTMAKPASDITPPEVESTSPAGGAVDAPRSSDVVVVFNEVMSAATINTGTVTLRDGVVGVSGTVSLDATGKIALFRPGSPLAYDTLYTASVSTGVTDAAGNTLAADHVWQFRTVKPDTLRPTVVNFTPLDGATGVNPSSVLTARFSEAMDPSTINGSTFSLGGVTGLVGYDAGTFTASFTPLMPLAFAKNYTATISTGARDLAGNVLERARSWTFTTVKDAAAPSQDEYCQVPPFVAGADGVIKPNVLLIVDNSGSMYEFAYKAKDKGQNSYDDSYNPALEYYGYFDDSRMYRYDGGNFLVDEGAVLDKSSFWSGNLLNWLTMRRVDIVRKVLVGGKTVPRSANTANYLIPAENTDRDTMKTYNNVRYLVRKGASTAEIYNENSRTTYKLRIYVGNQPPQDGLVLRYSDRIRFGIMLYNDGYRFEGNSNSVRDGGQIAADIGSMGRDLITKIEGADPRTWTPLAETFYEATRYFQATTSAYNGGTYSGKDPIEYRCQKNFILILTDGESTKDRNLPGGYWSGTGKVTDANFNIRTWMDSIAAQEAEPSKYGVSANTDQGSYYLQGVAYYAHVTDLRSLVYGNDIKDKQNITTYTVFAFDDSETGRDLLQMTAKYGGFDDFDGSGKPDNVAKWDKNKDDLPDTYFEPRNGLELEQSLLKAFSDILGRVSSGTASSILSSSEGSGANLLQAVFYPKKYFDDHTEATWIGEIQNLWYHLDPKLVNSTVREDKEPYGRLDLDKDNIIQFYFDESQGQTLVRSWTDANGDGVPDIGSIIVKRPEEVGSLWNAGRLLWKRDSGTRTIYAADPTRPSPALAPFNTADETGGIHTSWRWWNALQAANGTEAKKIIDYVNGEDQPGYRSRKVKIGVPIREWKLGDIISSTPRFQPNTRLNTYDRLPPSGYSDSSYASYLDSDEYKGRGMVYAGANDGMLHAFRLGLLDVSGRTKNYQGKMTGEDIGKEEWAFIPKNALPYLKYLADPQYSHLFYVDNTVSLNDVSINPVPGNERIFPDCQDATSGEKGYWNCRKTTTFLTDLNGKPTGSLDIANTSWRTVLIGGMGLGGASREYGSSCSSATECVKAPVAELGYSSYFALDVTNPYKPVYMWEFAGDLSSPDPGQKDYLGYATTGPAVVRVGGKNTNGRWFAVFGSGPTGPIDRGGRQFIGASNQNLKLFIVDLRDGRLVHTINTGIPNAFAGSISNSMIDTERGSFGSPGNYQDNAVYIGYVQRDGTGEWNKGGVIRLVTRESVHPDSPDEDRKWEWYTVIDGIGPVTSAVAKLQDRRNSNLWLYFGTGRYFHKQDDLASRRAIYGILDPCYLKTTNTLDPYCSTKRTTSELKNQTDNPSANLGGNYQGWYINLDEPADGLSAERVITDPVASPNGVVFFTTFMPTSDICGFGGNSHIWAVDYYNGAVPPASTMNGKALLQVSTGAFVEVPLASAFKEKGGRRTSDMTGVPPKSQGLSLTLLPLPMKKILQIQEK